MDNPASLTKSELIKLIIKNDLIFNRLLHGCAEISFDTDNQNLNLHPAINYLIGITDPELCSKFSEFYFQMTERLKDVKGSNFRDVFHKRCGHVTAQLLRKESFIINKKRERRFRIRCANGEPGADCWNNERLIMHLIKSDLIHRRVLFGFSKLGFDTTNYQLNLDECVIWLVGEPRKEKQNKMKTQYSALAEKAKNINLTSTNQEIENLGAEIYHHIQAIYMKSAPAKK